MDGGQRAVQSRGHAQFLEGQVGLFMQQHAQLLPMMVEDPGLAAGTMVLGAEVANPAALLEQFLNEAQRDAETAGHRLPGIFPLVVSRQNPLAQIQRNGRHAPSLTDPPKNGYSFV